MISKYKLIYQTHQILRIVLVCIIVIVTIYPIYWFGMISLKTQKEAFKTPPDFIFKPTFQHYKNIFRSNVAFGRYYLNSIVVSFGSTAIALIAGVTAAYSLSRAQFRLKNSILVAILGSRMVPPVLFIIPYYVAFTKLGLIDTRIGLIGVFLSFNLTLVVWSMRAFFDQIPQELEEAAFIDGASDFTTFFKVTLPLASPGIAATTVLCLILSWNEFVYALLLTQLKAMTAPVAVVIFASHEAADYGIVAAGAIVLTLPVIVATLLVRKYLVFGLLGGAIKE
jgi:multiple sugar transport system permease protein